MARPTHLRTHLSIKYPTGLRAVDLLIHAPICQFWLFCIDKVNLTTLHTSLLRNLWSLFFIFLHGTRHITHSLHRATQISQSLVKSEWCAKTLDNSILSKFQHPPSIAQKPHRGRLHLTNYIFDKLVQRTFDSVRLNQTLNCMVEENLFKTMPVAPSFIRHLCALVKWYPLEHFTTRRKAATSVEFSIHNLSSFDIQKKKIREGKKNLTGTLPCAKTVLMTVIAAIAMPSGHVQCLQLSEIVWYLRILIRLANIAMRTWLLCTQLLTL